MSKRPKRDIEIGQFIVTGTANLLTANQALQKLFQSKQLELREARFRLNGKTITIKPRTRTS